MTWPQVYNPLHHTVLSTGLAAAPVVVLPGGIAFWRLLSANSAGGVMGKMIDAQSIVVASTAANWYGHESSILRFVFSPSLALAVLMGLLVSGEAAWPLLQHWVVR